MELAYVTVRANKPGERIGIVKLNEKGYYLAKGYDYAPHTIEEVQTFVSELNQKMGVPDDVAESASFGSMFGWDCPGAARAVAFMTPPVQPQPPTRQEIEREIVGIVVADAIAAGYAVRLFDGESWAGPRTEKADEIMTQIQATDEERLYVYTFDQGAKPVRLGSIFFVYGNDGYDVINDHTASPAIEAILTRANARAEELEEATTVAQIMQDAARR